MIVHKSTLMKKSLDKVTHPSIAALYATTISTKTKIPVDSPNPLLIDSLSH
jgi:hypothetical protein